MNSPRQPPRPYKESSTHEEAVRIIAESSGKQFDPALIEIFLLSADQFKNISYPTDL
jgi:response regulator RpfG family c-di-GMP phosphodiesterase